jgi:AraC-like DNA-binding protein
MKAMRYRQISPGIGTAQIVSHYWTLEADSVPDASQRIVPDGHPEMILNLGDPFQSMGLDGRWHLQPRSFFAGQIAGPLLVRATGRTRILGIRFHPWGARSVLQAPQQHFNSRMTPLDDILKGLPDQIAAIDSHLGRLGAMRSRDLLIEGSAEHISAQGGQVELGRFAAEAGISIRQWERRFLDAVGLPPKLFSRIQRFQRVLRELADQENWADTALRCGYYDQAHLINDFRDFSGETPARLVSPGSDLAWEMSHFSKANRTA